MWRLRNLINFYPEKSAGRFLINILVPVFVALLFHYIFRLYYFLNLLGVMTVGFLFCVPMLMGALTVMLSRKKDVESRTFCALMPWVNIVVFMILTLSFNTEGWGCWVMATPLFMGMSSIGGLIARHYQLQAEYYF